MLTVMHFLSHAPQIPHAARSRCCILVLSSALSSLTALPCSSRSSFCVWAGASQDQTDRGECQYNELVLKGEAYKRALPRVVEAIFYPLGGESVVHHAEGSKAQAAELHARFLKAYGLSIADAPLLAFDVVDGRSRRYDSRPWRLG